MRLQKKSVMESIEFSVTDFLFVLNFITDYPQSGTPQVRLKHRLRWQ